MRQLVRSIHFINFGDDDKAEIFIRHKFESEWSDILVYEYGNIKQTISKNFTNTRICLRRTAWNLYHLWRQVNRLSYEGKAEILRTGAALDTQTKPLATESSTQAMGDTKKQE